MTIIKQLKHVFYINQLEFSGLHLDSVSFDRQDWIVCDHYAMVMIHQSVES